MTSQNDRSRTKSEWLYDMRWWLSAALIAVIGALFAGGMGRVAEFSARVDSLKDNPPELSEPKMFDARYDIWFDPDDPGLQLYKRIEDQFVAEDFVLVAFEEREHPLGVFSPEALSTIAKVTARIESVPFVRHVRSLTSNPWIRWGEIEDSATGESESGLLITDLFEGDPASYGEDAIVERAVAVLGYEKAVALLGADKVDVVVGSEADRSDLIGEPRLIGNVISADGRSTAFQVQLLRPRLGEERQRAAFGDDAAARLVGRSMHANQSQWDALHEIEGALEELGGKYEFHFAGMPSIERNFMETGQADMVMVLYMFGAIALVMFLLFRRISAVLMPMTVVFSSIFGMLGAVWLLGDLLNNITAGAPNMVTAISIADAIHLIAAYYGMRSRFTDKRALIGEVIRRNALPVFLTSVTTAIGFFSLTAGNIIPLQMLGYTAGLGTVFAWITSMVFVPAILSMLPLPKSSAAERVNDTSMRPTGEPDAHWSTPLVERVVAWRRSIVVGSFIVTAVAVVGVARIHLDSDFRTMFPDDNVAMVDMDWIEKRLGGSGDLEIVFEAPPRSEAREVTLARQARLEELRTRQLGATEMPDDYRSLSGEEAAELTRLRGEEDDFQRRRIAISADFLDQLTRFGDRMRGEMDDAESPLHIVTRIDGALDVLRKMSQVQNENRAAYYRPPIEADVPDEARIAQFSYDEITEEAEFIPAQNASTLAAQYFLQYENGAKPAENLATLISADRRTVRLQGRVKQASSLEQKAAFARIREIADAEFPLLTADVQAVENGEANSSMTLSGKTLLYAGMSDKFSRSFVFSMSVALTIITLLIMVIYRSVIIGLLSIVPNVLPIFIPIGIFGLLGWDVDGPAVFVSSVALGVCVDDTIHFFTKFTRARRRGLSTEAALRAAFHEVGNALTFTTAILVLGFAVLAFSEFAPNSMMGKLAAVMIALAWIADFIVTPALLTLLPDPNRSDATATNESSSTSEPEVPALT